MIINRWIANHSEQSFPIFHILVPGLQLYTQANDFLDDWESKGYVREPSLGSILIYLLLKQYGHSHKILVSFVAADTNLADINNVHTNFICQSKHLPVDDIANVSVVWTLCSHFFPIQSIIKFYRLARSRNQNCSHLKIVELQHGWVPGKTSILRNGYKNNTNPDVYLTFDSISSQYIESKYLGVRTSQVGDVLFVANYALFSNLSDLDGDKNKESCNLLVCFSQKMLSLVM